MTPVELETLVVDLRKRVEELESLTPARLGTCHARVYPNTAPSKHKFTCSRLSVTRCSECGEARCAKHVLGTEDGKLKCYMGCEE